MPLVDTFKYENKKSRYVQRAGNPACQSTMPAGDAWRRTSSNWSFPTCALAQPLLYGAEDSALWMCAKPKRNWQSRHGIVFACLSRC